MSYDHVWLKTAKEPTKWLDIYGVENAFMRAELEVEFDRLYAQGHFVTLAAGKNCLHDELFLFENNKEAQEFYNAQFKAWELFAEDEDEGYGFDEISLYEAKCLVFSKPCGPTMRSRGLTKLVRMFLRVLNRCF